MNAEQFQPVVARRVQHIQDSLTRKRGEYASDADVLHNFATASAFQGLPMTQVGWNFLVKHLVSIQDMVANPIGYAPETWNEKLGDAINYLILIDAMLEESYEAERVQVDR